MVKVDLEDGVATLTLDRPQVLNALTRELALAALVALREVVAGGARAILLTGAGRAFSSGADLGSAAPAVASGAIAEQVGRDMAQATNPLIEAIADAPVPVVCAVNGPCVGGGVGLALAADVVVAARSAYFLIPQVAALGIVPDLGATWELPRKIGRARALGMQLLGDRITAERAEQWGLIWQCVDDAGLREEALRIARLLASMPGDAVRAARALTDGAATATLAQQLESERQAQMRLLTGDFFRDAVLRFNAAPKKS